jgi:hypothetical protein
VIVDDEYQWWGRRVPGTTIHRFVCPRKNPRRRKYRVVENGSVAFLTNRRREVVPLIRFKGLPPASPSIGQSLARDSLLRMTVKVTVDGEGG